MEAFLQSQPLMQRAGIEQVAVVMVHRRELVAAGRRRRLAALLTLVETGVAKLARSGGKVDDKCPRINTLSPSRD